MAHILIVDDEDKMRHLLSITLEQAGHRVDQAPNGAVALEKITNVPYDMVISDIKMPRMSGPELLNRMKAEDIPCPIVFITAFATVESAVEAMRLGAADYITKPFELERVTLAVERTLNLSKLLVENRKLKEELFKLPGTDKIICESAVMQKLLSTALKVAKSDSAVCISGESGTGKELMARFIHRHSNRQSGRFVAINCAAISTNLVESELFGYEKGAFTGAERRTQGKFEYSGGGTLFMDEIGDLSLEAQSKVLRALQEKRIMRVGGNEEVAVDVRLVCATNKNLGDLVAAGTFRQDLFFRINVIPMEIPSLRVRKEDVIPLCEFFLDRFLNGKPVSITDGAKRVLLNYPWPGNVRELANAMERASIFTAEQGAITAETLSFLDPSCIPQKENPLGFELPPEGVSFEEVKKEMVRQAMKAAGDNQTLAAKLLGVSRAKFRVLLKYANKD